MFNFFRKRTIGSQPNGDHTDKLAEAQTSPEHIDGPVPVVEGTDDKLDIEIPEHIFVEYEKPKNAPMETDETPTEVVNLQTLYKFLERNLETQGYEDALKNPDSSYMNENVISLENELLILISRVNTYYKRHLGQVDFHIETRKRHNMNEIVDELLTHKASTEEDMKIVALIEEDTRNRTGIAQSVILSYQRGFRNGFAAITYNGILSGK